MNDDKQSYLVECVRRVDVGNGEMVIDKLRLSVGGNVVELSKPEVIELIEAGNRVFTFVRTDYEDGFETDLIVEVSDEGNKYLTTPPNNTIKDNLDEVGECW